MTAFYLKPLFEIPILGKKKKKPISKYSDVLSDWEVRLQHMNVGGHNSARNTT